MAVSDLLDAIEQGDLTALRRALAKGPLQESLDAYGRPPVRAAASCRRSTPEILQEVLDAGGDPENRGTASWTALEGAVWEGRVGMVRVLAPDMVLTEALERGIQEMQLHAAGGWSVRLFPNARELLAIQRESPRHLENHWSFTGAEALDEGARILKAAETAWLRPFLRELVSGAPLAVGALEEEHRERFGRTPGLTIWEDGFRGPITIGGHI